MASECLRTGLNSFEATEFRLDNASQGNLNFAVISTYRGELESELVQTALIDLQQRHPLLQVGPRLSSLKVMEYIKASSPIPFRECPYSNATQWKEIVKEDLAKRFTKEDEPLWRVTLLKGEHEGQLIVTFHHAIADGVCAMEMMNHLFTILSDRIDHKLPTLPRFDQPLPELSSLFPLSSKEPTDDLEAPMREDKGYHTNFIKGSLDKEITSSVLTWTKAQGIRVNATLFAALLLAVRHVVNPDFESFTAMTSVNFRPSFTPPLSKEVLALFRTCISEELVVKSDQDFTSLAKALDQSVHAQLEAGEHVLNLKRVESRLRRDISPQELWQRSKFPDNAINITNLGSLQFSGRYNNLRLDDLHFVANVDPFIEHPTNFIMGCLSFEGRFSLSLWFVEELVDESVAFKILSEVESILAVHCRADQ